MDKLVEKESTIDEYLNEYSARVKNIYIELPDYEYFHSPSGVSRQDKRFIGRKKILDKLETILSYSKSRAGAYLVTGYRGMGKTSLVRKVIAEMKAGAPANASRWLALQGGFAAISLTILFVLIATFLQKKEWDTEWKSFPWKENPAWFYIIAIATPVLLFLIHLVVVNEAWLGKPNGKMEDSAEGKQFFEMEGEVRQRLYSWVIGKFSIVQNLELEISLSQEDIREFGFLGLLAKKLEIVYRDFRKPLFSYRRFLASLIRFSFIMFIFILIYGSIESYCYRSGNLIPQLDGIFLFDSRFLLGQRLILFILFALLIWNSSGWVNRIMRGLGMVTHHEIQQRLKILTERIDASVTLENGPSAKGTFKGFGWNLGQRRIQSFSVASAKEVEFELIDILNDIDDLISIRGYRPRFICVFDELDKIQLDNTTVALGASNESSSRDVQDSISRKLRARQEKISTILANLKHFLNVAKAKFIFIAGREMFDASLADISDRDFFLGSIFHEIVYVESFLKDQSDPRAFGITHMIEMYLCRQLFPKNLAQQLVNDYEEAYAFRLERYYKDVLESQIKKWKKVELKRLEESKMDEPEKDREQKKIIKQQELLAFRNRKALAVLQNFVIFLVYRSNGTPKKLTNLFEKYIVKLEKDDFGGEPTEINSKRDLIIYQSPSDVQNDQSPGFYLKFDYNDQYQLGLIAYLFRPYLLSASQYMKSFGDKLLFSTAYLVDHLFKFHPWAFSWRTLELMPELVYANKSPELRSFIGKLLSSLQNVHIREIVYGVFEYKFYNKIRHEISFISKTQEQESAAFNFTLDESMHIKVHFQRRLRRLIDQSERHPARKEGDYYQSLSFLHTTLGDIYYYDQEFDEALIAYSEAVAIYGGQTQERLSPHQLTNWMKARLKMGLVFEKMGANDDALSVYEGLLMDLDQFFSNNASHLPREDRAGFAKALFENLRYFQLPFVAKLVMIEKEGISGISYRDIMNNEARMIGLLDLSLEGAMVSSNWITRISDPKKKETQEFLVRAYYHLNVGSVLYFKNGSVIHAKSELESKDRKLWKIWEAYLTGIDIPIEKNFKAPRSALMEYFKSFLNLAARLQAYSDEIPIDGNHHKQYNNRSSIIEEKTDPPQDLMAIQAFDWIEERIESSILQRRVEILDLLHGDLSEILENCYTNPTPESSNNKEKNEICKLLMELKEWERTNTCTYSSFQKIVDQFLDENKWGKSKKHIQKIITKVLKLVSVIVILERIVQKLKRKHPVYLFLAYGVWFFYLPYSQSRYINKDKNILSTLAIILSKMGDTLLCFTHKKPFVEFDKWSYLFWVHDTLIGKSSISTISQFHKDNIELANNNSDLIFFSNFFYLLSGQYYLKTGKPQNYEFQLRKMLYFLKDYVSNGTDRPKKEDHLQWAQFLLLIRRKLVRNALKAITWANEITNRPQVFKQKRNFGISGYSGDYDSQILYDYVSNASEAKEINMLYAEIELHVLQNEKAREHWQEISENLELELGKSHSEKTNKGKGYPKFPSFDLRKPLVNPYSSYSTKFMRMLELNFKVQCNFLILFEKGYRTFDEKSLRESWEYGSNWIKMILNKYIEPRGSADSKSVLGTQFELEKRNDEMVKRITINEPIKARKARSDVGNLIIESLFCLNEMIKIQEIFGQNYMTNYSFIGYAHLKLGDWCYVYLAYLDYLSNYERKGDLTNSFLSDVRKVVETTNTAYLEPKYHYELAVQDFYKAIQMHNCGNTYFQQIQRMHFLEDDFSDNMYHFSAALERYKINLGVFRKKIGRIKMIKNTSKTFDYESYVNRAPLEEES